MSPFFNDMIDGNLLYHLTTRHKEEDYRIYSDPELRDIIEGKTRVSQAAWHALIESPATLRRMLQLAKS